MTKKKITEKPMPPALVALAKKIEQTAQHNAQNLYDRLAGRMTAIQQHTGATVEILQATIEIMGCQPCLIHSAANHPVFVEFARQEIINKLIQEDKKDEL
jgi:Tat protein secretion system quality control protein TatD with DNase activity